MIDSRSPNSRKAAASPCPPQLLRGTACQAKRPNLVPTVPSCGDQHHSRTLPPTVSHSSCCVLHRYSPVCSCYTASSPGPVPRLASTGLPLCPLSFPAAIGKFDWSFQGNLTIRGPSHPAGPIPSRKSAHSDSTYLVPPKYRLYDKHDSRYYRFTSFRLFVTAISSGSFPRPPWYRGVPPARGNLLALELDERSRVHGMLTIGHSIS